LDQFTRKAAGAVAFFDDGDQVVFDELASGGTHQPFFLGQEGIVLYKVDATEFDGRHNNLLGMGPRIFHRKQGKQFAAYRTKRAQEGKHMTVAGARERGQRRPSNAISRKAPRLRMRWPRRSRSGGGASDPFDGARVLEVERTIVLLWIPLMAAH